jgi:AAA+ superfamily predicted ATPase
VKEIERIEEKITNPDKLSLGTLLSRFDGIGNYDGLIIIATTNKIESLDKALYREMRLTPIKFEYCRKKDIIDMIEDYYKVKLLEDEMNIPEIKIIPAKLKVLIEQNSTNYKVLLDKLRQIEK